MFTSLPCVELYPHHFRNGTHLSHQGHTEAAVFVGSIYYWGQGVAIDYARAIVAFKVGAEGGNSTDQWTVGHMYYSGRGVDVDYAQALPWIEKAAAQDNPNAVVTLGTIYFEGHGVTPSWRRAREYSERASGLGSPKAAGNIQILTNSIRNVTSKYINRPFATRPHAHTPPAPSSRTRRSPPSWTSGWSSTARAART